jgi:hypothetical protein
VRRSAAALASLSLLLLSTGALADGPPDSAACVDAYSKAQTLRNEKKFVEARAAMLVCAQPSCKDFIVRDCTEWLDQVRSALPTVVAMAADPAGNPLLDVKVTMDGAPFVDKIDGRSVEVDPGPHKFTFTMADGTTADKTVVVAEGEHDKRVAVTLGKAPASTTPTAAPVAAPAAAPAGGPAQPAPESGGAGGGSAMSEKRSPLKLIGLASAGVGVAGLAVGSVFGIVALSKKSSASSGPLPCNSSGMCQSLESKQSWSDAQSAANLSTIFFIAGGVLAAGGVALWALAPTEYVQVSPTVGFESAGLEVKGAW